MIYVVSASTIFRCILASLHQSYVPVLGLKKWLTANLCTTALG